MPKFHAAGVTARLSVADLSNTLPDLSSILDTTKKPAPIDYDQTGVKLLKERPIGADGGVRGVLQLLGEYENLAFMMAEASEEFLLPHGCEPPIRHVPVITEKTPRTQASPLSIGPQNSSIDETVKRVDSRRTSPYNLPSGRHTPSNSTPRTRAGTSLRTSVGRSSSILQHLPPDVPTLAVVVPSLDTNVSKKALVLSVETTQSTYYQKLERQAKDRPHRYLKVEVFFDGQLTHSTFINPAASGRENLHLFAGTRVNEKQEKPWVYGPRSPSKDDASAHWHSISVLVEKEATLRKTGSPSADYLTSLAKIELPERLNDTYKLSIIDILVTIGEGRKSAQDQYITKPTRMVPSTADIRSAGLSSYQSPSAMRDTTALPEYSGVPSGKDVDGRASKLLPMTNPASPSRLISPTLGSVAVTPSKRSVRGFSKRETAHGEFNESAPPSETSGHSTLRFTSHQKKVVESYKCKSGHMAGRTVSQRVGNLKMMLPANKTKTLRDLKLQLGEEMHLIQAELDRDPETRGLQLSGDVGRDKLNHLVDGLLEGPTQRQRYKQHLKDDEPPSGKDRDAAVPTTRPRAVAKLAVSDALDTSESLADGIVGHAGGDLRRQIARSRPGYFDEEEFVVGMRFVVV